MLAEFDLLLPGSLPEALEMLSASGPDVLPLAGGTNLLVDIRGGRRKPPTLVNIAGLREIREIRRDNGYLVIGSAVTIAEILDSPLVQEAAPVLHETAGLFANPLVRNRATIGGNLADASPAADSAPPLLALGAEVGLAKKGEQRWVPIDEFFLGVRQTVRLPSELLTAVRIPEAPPRSAAAFAKLGLRKSDVISVLSAAVMATGDEKGRCKQARIALGAVAPRPIRAHKAEQALIGQTLDNKAVGEVARLAAGEAQPIDDLRGSADYRRRVVEVLVRRLLTRVTREIGS
jgi:carbon-monoxide dehydrogenase medium subunit